MPRFSANIGFLWADLPLLDRIAAASRAGFRAVEMHWPYDLPAAEVRAACLAGGLEVLGINTPVDLSRGEFGLGAVPGRQADFRAGFLRAADYAREIGAGNVHVMAGDVPPEHRDDGLRVFSDNLAWASENAPDLTLLLEAINRRDRPGYFYDRTEAVATLMARVGAENLAMMFDAYHVGVAEGQVFERLEECLPLIGHVQIAAVPSRAEPDEGELDYRSFFLELDRHGYEGWVGCEYRPRAGTDTGLVWVETLGELL